MRRRYRDITVFNLSMLDVIASAMGAFLIIMVVVIPYFNKDSQRLVEENQNLKKQVQQQQAQIAAQQKAIQNQQNVIDRLREQVARITAQLNQRQNQNEQVRRLQQQLEQQRRRVATAEREAQSLREKLKRTFLIVMVSWKTPRHDVDLHVVDPTGHEFYFRKKTYSGVPGELSEDDTLGPGREVWVITKAPPGNYKVYYNLYAHKGNTHVAVVTGMVYHRDGYTPLRKVVLNRVKHKVFVGTITVHNDGSVTVH